MSLKLADVETQYKKNKKLKKADVNALMEWIEKEPHLPRINELQAVLFLHSCYYENEIAKATIDNFFTFKTHCTEIFKNKDKQLLKIQIDLVLLTLLPQTTPEGSKIFLVKVIDSNTDHFNFPLCIKYFDMVTMLDLHQEGTEEGHIGIIDFKGVTFGHVAKLGVFNLKKLLYYLQDALCVRIKALHFFNIEPFVDKVVALIKPFMKNELFQSLHLHETTEGLTKFIPLECLPNDYGGSAESLSVLHKNIKKKLKENKAFLEWEESLVVDESKRLVAHKLDDVLDGMDGTFKKLEID